MHCSSQLWPMLKLIGLHAPGLCSVAVLPYICKRIMQGKHAVCPIKHALQFYPSQLLQFRQVLRLWVDVTFGAFRCNEVRHASCTPATHGRAGKAGKTCTVDEIKLSAIQVSYMQHDSAQRSRQSMPQHSRLTSMSRRLPRCGVSCVMISHRTTP